MPPENNGKEPAATPDLRLIQQTLERAGAPADLLIPAGVEWLADAIARLTPLAKDGEQYRKDLIDSAEKEAVRAMGAETGAAQRSMLEASPLSLIKSFTESWRAIGDAALPGGRLSTDEPNAETPIGWKKVDIGGLSRS